MYEYSVYIDMVYNKDDWKKDHLIQVKEIIVSAGDEGEARTKALEIIKKDFPGNEFRVIDVNEIIIDEED